MCKSHSSEFHITTAGRLATGHLIIGGVGCSGYFRASGLMGADGKQKTEDGRC